MWKNLTQHVVRVLNPDGTLAMEIGELKRDVTGQPTGCVGVVGNGD